MSNSSLPVINIALTTDTSGSQALSMQILIICVPLILAPAIGLFSWYIRGYYEDQSKSLEHHKDEKKKYIITNIHDQIKLFYWPLYLHLIRYKQLVDRYKEFKAGHFSLSTYSHPDLLKSSPLNNQVPLPPPPQPPPQPQIVPESTPQVTSKIRSLVDTLKKISYSPQPVIDYVDDEIDLEKNLPPQPQPQKQTSIKDSVIEIKIDRLDSAKNDNSNSNSNKDIHSNSQLMFNQPPKNDGMGFTRSMEVINQFNQATLAYENQITQTLKKIQEIYTEYVAIGDPNKDLLRELVKLDEYITYIVTFRDLSTGSSTNFLLEEKIEKAKFPDQIDQMIGQQLNHLQSIYTDLVNNHNSSILRDPDANLSDLDKLN